MALTIQKSRLLLIIPLLFGLLLGGWVWNFKADVPDSPSSIQLGGDFTLESYQGDVSLQDFKGKAVLLFFGYTSCPDVCPTGLAKMSAAINLLTPEEAANVQPLFVSVDPERDDPQKLAKYSAYFHSSLIGLTGKKEDIDRVVKAYGAFYRKVELNNSALGYSMDHTTRIYLINRDGKLSGLLFHDTAPAEIAEKLRTIL
ncbi:MAG: SCO family protein [Amphritea sp.]